MKSYENITIEYVISKNASWFDIIEYAPLSTRLNQNMLIDDYMKYVTASNLKIYMVAKYLKISYDDDGNPNKCIILFTPYVENDKYLIDNKFDTSLFSPIKFSYNTNHKYFITDMDVIREKNKKIKNIYFYGLNNKKIYYSHDVNYMNIFDVAKLNRYFFA